MSVSKLKNGTYKVRYRIGQKQFTKSGFQTKREAEAYEAQQLRSIRTNSWTSPNAAKITLEAVFEDWIASKQASPKTVYDYRETWSTVISPSWGLVRLEHINPASLTRWIATESKRRSVARMNKVITVFSQTLDWAVADQRIPENPLKRAKALSPGPLIRSREHQEAKVFLTHEQVHALAERSGDYALMIKTMAYTGMRFGEVTALQGRDIDLLRKRIRVNRSFSDVKGHLLESTTKSGKSRVIPIPESIWPELKECVSSMEDLASLVFTTSTGHVIRYSRWRRDVFNRAAKSAGLTDITPHGLRHTYASLAIQAGANPKVLQSVLGHTDIRLTLDTYGHLYDDDLDQLAEQLDSSRLKSAQ